MTLKRSQSLSAVDNKRLKKNQRGKKSQSQQLRRFSLSILKNHRSSSITNKNLLSQTNKLNKFKQKILSYIDKRSDIEIINFYTEYKQQFLRKSTNLQNLFYQQPQIRQKYLNQKQDTHFYRGFQHTLLTLFRKGIIVAGQYKNMKQQTVQQIQKWVFSWIKRKKNYQQAILDQQTAIIDTMNVIAQINQLAKSMKAEKPIF